MDLFNIKCKNRVDKIICLLCKFIVMCDCKHGKLYLVCLIVAGTVTVVLSVGPCVTVTRTVVLSLCHCDRDSCT